MKKTLKVYTLKYLVVAFLLIIALWAALFYAFILEEVYDNIDDGLKNRKIQIIRETYKDPDLLIISSFGIEEFKITPLKNIDSINENQFKNEMIFMEYDDDIEPYRELKTNFKHSNGNTYALEIRTSTVEENELLQDLLYALVFLYLGMVLSVYLLYNTLLSKLWNPFFEVIKKLKTYRIGKSEKFEISKTDVDEFKVLKESLNSMISSNEINFKNQKQFTENASHELQTPIAIAVHKIDTLLEDSDLSENHLYQISDVKQVLERMSKLNKTLLLLSKIDNNQFLQTQQVNFNTLVKSISNEYQDLMDYNSLQFVYKENSNFSTEINPELAEILLSNLIRNAIKHTLSNGQIYIEVNDTNILIKNSAANGSLDANKIYNRFYKENNSTDSIGLGLAITSSIINQTQNLKIDYYFKEEFHHFEIIKT